MDLIVTLTLIGAAVALAALFGWLGARPPNPFKGPRMVPYRLLMVLCAVGALVLLTHLGALTGLVGKHT